MKITVPAGLTTKRNMDVEGTHLILRVKLKIKTIISICHFQISLLFLPDLCKPEFKT